MFCASVYLSYCVCGAMVVSIKAIDTRTTTSIPHGIAIAAIIINTEYRKKYNYHTPRLRREKSWIRGGGKINTSYSGIYVC